MKTRKIIVESGILLVLLAITLSFLLKNQDIPQIVNIIKGCKPGYIVLAILFMAFYAYVGGYEVYMFMKKRGYKMSPFRCFKYGFTEIFFSAITPSSTGGQPMMAMAMKDEGYPYTETAPALLAITGLYKVGVIILGILVCIVYGDRIFAMTDDSWVYFLFGFGFIANIVIILVVCLFLFSNKCIWSLFKLVLNIGTKLRIIKNRLRTEEVFKLKKNEYMVCANYMRQDPIVPLKVFVVTFLQRLALASVGGCVYMAMGIDTPGITFQYIVAIQIITAIAVELMPLPGAVGISETVFLSLNLSIYGTQSALNAGMLLTRGINFYLLFIVSAIFVNIAHIAKMTRHLKKKV